MLELLVSELETMTLEASVITVLGQEVALAVVEEFVYLGSLVHSTTQSSPHIVLEYHNSPLVF